MTDAERPAVRSELAELARSHEPVPALFAADPRRFERYSWEADGLLLDLSRHPLTGPVFERLIEFARVQRLPEAVEALFTGEPVNRSEGRAALHPALRGSVADSLVLDGERVTAQVAGELERMERLVRPLRDGTWLGARGDVVTDVIHLGVGGSELGPAMAVDALTDPRRDPWPRVWFASSSDGRDLARHLEVLDPARTVFIVASKSFTTLETLTAARTARDWLARRLVGIDPERLNEHFIGVSANDAAMAEFGVPEPQRLRIREWVGGRYSIASPMGMPLAVRAGMDVFRTLLEGMRSIDHHFRHAPLEANLPALLALSTLWQLDDHGACGHVVLPYHPALRRIPAYLQQLDMESLGKSVTRDGAWVRGTTGGAFWGDVGTNAQHSFFQWLHQGTGRAVIEMWVPDDDEDVPSRHRGLGPASALGQAQALMQGQPATDPDERHRHQPGGRPVTLLLFPQLDAYRLGQLVALHEHRVYAQAVLWGINPFDQWGVELGKTLSGRLSPVLRGEAQVPEGVDGATRGAIAWLHARRAGR